MQIPKRFFEIGFDQEEFDLRFLKMPPRVYKECVRLYFKSNDIERLQKLFREKKWKEANDCAHNLKGSSGNLAMMELYRTYAKIIKALKSSDPESAAELIEQAAYLENEFRIAAYGLLKPRKK